MASSVGGSLSAGHHDGERARHGAVVAGRPEVVVQAAIGHRHGDDRAAGDVGHRRVAERARRRGARIGDRRVRNEAGVVARGGHLQQLGALPGAGGDPGQVHGLQPGIFGNRRRIGDRIERRRVVHAGDGHRELAAERPVVARGREVVVEAAIGHRDRHDRRAERIGDRRVGQRPGGIRGRVADRGRRDQGRRVARRRHLQRLGLTAPGGDAGQIHGLQAGVLENRRGIRNRIERRRQERDDTSA